MHIPQRFTLLPQNLLARDIYGIWTGAHVDTNEFSLSASLSRDPKPAILEGRVGGT